MLCDIHNHIGKNMNADQLFDYYTRLKNANGIDRNCILSIPVSPSAKYYHTQNLLALQLKDMLLPYSSAFMGLVHGSAAEDYLTQLKKGLAMGFEGLKILEGKPDRQMQTGVRIWKPEFDEMFED